MPLCRDGRDSNDGRLILEVSGAEGCEDQYRRSSESTTKGEVVWWDSNRVTQSYSKYIE